MGLMYCKKCGRVVQRISKCDCCDSLLNPVPEKYWLDGLNFLITDESEQLLIEELIKPSPEFDQYLFDHRREILEKRDAGYQNWLENRNKSVKCSYCGSTNVKKISATSRVVSTGIFGIASKKIGKQWHCNQCGSDF